MATTVSLTKINFMSEDTFNKLSSLDSQQLYAVEASSLITSVMNNRSLAVSQKQAIDTSFTAPSSGILSVRNTSKGTFTVIIDNIEIVRSFFYDSQDTTSIVIPIGIGQKAEITFAERFFIPFN